MDMSAQPCSDALDISLQNRSFCSMSDYGNASYWDARYSAQLGGGNAMGELFDWYQDYSTLRPLLEKFLRRDPSFEILIPGCGNSKLGCDLYDDGYANITNIDLSSVVISAMNQRCADTREHMEFTVMDARHMEYIPDNCFNLIIDKGLMDAVFCSQDNLASVAALVDEMHRVTKSQGVYLVISHAPPEHRLPYLQAIKGDNAWAVKHVTIPKPPLTQNQDPTSSEFHHVYICQKP